MGSLNDLFSTKKKLPPRQPSLNDLFSNKQPSSNNLPEIVDITNTQQYNLPEIVDITGTGVQPVDVSDMFPQSSSVQPVDITDMLPQNSSVQPVDISDMLPQEPKRKATAYDLLRGRANTALDKYYGRQTSAAPWEKTVAKGAAALLAAPISMLQGAGQGISNFLQSNPFGGGGFIQPQYAPSESQAFQQVYGKTPEIQGNPSGMELLKAAGALGLDIPGAAFGGAIHEGLPLPVSQAAEWGLEKGTEKLSQGVDAAARISRILSTGATPNFDNLATNPSQFVTNLSGGEWGPEQQQNSPLPYMALKAAELGTNPLIAFHIGKGMVKGAIKDFKTPKAQPQGMPSLEFTPADMMAAEQAKPAPVTPESFVNEIMNRGKKRPSEIDETPARSSVQPIEITPEELIAMGDEIRGQTETLPGKTQPALPPEPSVPETLGDTLLPSGSARALLDEAKGEAPPVESSLLSPTTRSAYDLAQSEALSDLLKGGELGEKAISESAAQADIAGRSRLGNLLESPSQEIPGSSAADLLADTRPRAEPPEVKYTGPAWEPPAYKWAPLEKPPEVAVTEQARQLLQGGNKAPSPEGAGLQIAGGVPDQANGFLNALSSASTGFNNWFDNLTAGKFYKKWFKPGGEFPDSLEPDRRLWKKETELGPAKVREYGNLTEVKYNEQGRPQGILGAAQYAEKLSEPEYNLMMQAVHDADPTLLNQIKTQNVVNYNGQDIPISPGFRNQTIRSKNIWEQSRDMTSDSGLITPEMRAQGYTPDSWLLTNAMKEEFEGLQDIVDHPNFSKLNPDQQSAIKRLITGDIKNPDFLWKDTKGRGSMEMLKEKTAKTPAQAAWLGGKLPQNYIDMARMAQMWEAGSMLKFAKAISENPDCVRTVVPGEIPARGWVPLYANPFEGRGAVPKMVGEILRGGGDVMIRDGVLRELKDHFDTKGNVIDSKSAAGQLLKGTEKVTTPWKFGATVASPETHFSNALWNKISSYIAVGPLKGADRAFVNRAMSGNGMSIESQVAELSGIMNAGFMNELGTVGKPGLAELLLKDTRQSKIDKAFKAGSVLTDKAGQRYQGAEIKSKAGIVGAELRKNGYSFENNALKTPDGRIVTEPAQLIPEDLQVIRGAGELADGFLFDYADQPRIIKLARRTIQPFVTFWANLLPLVSKLATGRGPDGKVNFKMLARFYSVPALLYSADKLGKALSGIDEDEAKKLRDTRNDAYLRNGLPWKIPFTNTTVGDTFSDIIHPTMPLRINPQTGKYSWGWDHNDPNAKPVSLNLQNVLPYSTLNKPIGALSLPQAIFPSGPWVDTLIGAATGRRTFGNSQIIDPYSENPRMDFLKYSALNLLPQVKAADRIIKAAKGEPARLGERAQTVPEALLKSISPIDAEVANIELSDSYKRAALKAEEEGFRKSVYKKYAPMLLLNANNPARLQKIQADMQREHLKRQKKWLLDSYPSQARSTNTEWGKMLQDIDAQLQTIK